MFNRQRTIRRSCIAVGMLLGLGWLLGAGSPRAWAEVYGDIEVAVQPQPALEGRAPTGRAGYLEYRVVVRNQSKSRDHTVNLVYPSRDSSYASGDHLASVSRAVQVAHGSGVTVSLFSPPVPSYDDTMAVEIDGYRKDRVLRLENPFGTSYGGYDSRAQQTAVLAGRGIAQDLKDAIRSGHEEEVVFFRSELPVSQWSPNWQGYTSYGVVLVTDHEAAEMPPDVVQALRRYVEAGGVLLIQGGSRDPSKLVPVPLREGAAGPPVGRLYHVGFGLVGTNPETWPVDFFGHPKEPLIPPGRDVQVVGGVTVPVRGLLLLVTLFAIGIGPVNFWILSRRQKRMWLWWNVPAVSIVTCLAIFAYSLFSEGWTSRGRTVLLTLLDENSHQATTLGYVSYYCPLTPPGLHFSYQTEVTPLYAAERSFDRFGNRSTGMARTLDWTNDQHLESGWVASRVPAVFAIRNSETHRERLTIRVDAKGERAVVNSLGAPIDTLFYMSDKGELFTAVNLPAGQEKQLQPDPIRSVKAKRLSERRSLRDLYRQDWTASLDQLKEAPEEYLTPGQYVAVIKNSPFLAKPLRGAVHEGDWGIVYGIAARSENGR